MTKLLLLATLLITLSYLIQKRIIKSQQKVIDKVFEPISIGWQYHQKIKVSFECCITE
jgi:hypothetical protein